MIDRSLILLTRLRFVARLRAMRRALSTPLGIMFFSLGCLVFAMWLVPAIIRGFIGYPHSDPESVRQAAPLWLLGVTLVVTLLSGGGKIITFSAADIDFLFPGPFSRHTLVLYKIAVTAFAALFSALFFMIWLGRYASSPIAAFFGTWLEWLFMQSLAMLILLARQTVAERRSKLPARLGMGLLLVLLIVAGLEILRPLFAGTWDFNAVRAHARDTLPARIVLAPFDVLTRAFTAQRIWPDLLQWAGLSSAMIAALIGLILMFDRQFIETALVASERVQARVKRARRGGGNPFAAARPIARFRIGMLPWLGGAGPLAWRQLTTAVRGARGLLVVLILLALGVGPMLWAVSRNGVSSTIEIVAPLLGISGVWLIFVLPSMLRFDFRGDLAHMDNLKLLPLPPRVVAIGQMLTPLIILTLLVWMLAAVACSAMPQLALGGLAVAAFAPCGLMLVIGVENAIFLMFPTAQKMQTPADLTVIGRSMVTALFKMLMLFTGLGIAAGVGGATYALTRSWPITLCAAWLVLAASAAATVPIVARLFARFDPSMDRPPE